MILIAHRGNTKGPEPEMENNPTYIYGVVEKGYECEVDVRYIDNKFYLGHDYPQYKVDLEFLKNPRLWCHAKDGTTLRKLLSEDVHCFYDYSKDMNYTLTSKGYIWHWDGRSMIYVMDSSGLIGICSDYVGYLK